MYIILVGINTISRRLIDELSQNHDLVVIEGDKEKAERIYSETAATIVNGSPTKLSVLEDAGISKADVLVTVQKDDNENMVICMIGKKYGVPKLVTRLENPEYRDIYNILEVNTIEYTDIVYGEFMSVIEHPAIMKIANVGAGKEILEIVVRDGSPLEGLRIDEIRNLKKFPRDNVEFSAVLREEDVIQPRDMLRVKNGDSVIVIIDPSIKGRLNKILGNDH